MKTNARILVLGVFAASLLNLTPTLQAQVATNLAPAYRIVDLGILPGGPDDSYAVGVNNAGQVIGQCNTHSFIWDATNGMRDVGSLTDGTWLYAINNQGVAVGMCDWGIACQWDSVDGIQACGPGAIAGYPYYAALAINDSGAIGYANWSWYGPPGKAYLISGGTTSWIGELYPGGRTLICGMNNGNDMVGWSGSPNSLSGSPNTYAGGPIQAFLWNSSQGIVGLGFLAGCTNSQANSINDSNQIVGICFNWDPINTENSNTAFIWTSGAGMAQLVSSNIGGTNSGANAISAGGIAVGSSQIGGTNQAVAWAPGQNAVVLNTLVTNLNVDGWTNITEAGGINSYGMIVGDGLKTNGVRHAFILYPAAAPAGQCVPPPSGMVGWWPGDGNANDISGNGLNGVLMNGTSFAPGVVGQAFNFDGVSNYVQVATTDSLNPVQGQGWTVEGWIRPATNIGEMPIAQKGNEMGTTDPYDYGRQYWTFGTDESKLIFEVGHTGYNVESMISSNGIALNQWSHVAVVVTNIGGPGDSYTFYINGTNAGTQIAIEGSVASITTTEPLRIGAAKDWNDIVSYHFQGQIDELAIYNRALSASEIAAIYSAGSAGKCKPLEMITQPQSQTGFWGGNVTLSVTASSISPPLYYQWLQNGVPIANATNATLVLNNLQSTNAGSYTVVVTDSAGNAMTSNPANLTVNAAVVSIALYAGVTISGVVGQTYGIQSTINLNNTNSWAGMTNITLSTPSQIWYDAQPANQSQCFYRVVAGPISIP